MLQAKFLTVITLFLTHIRAATFEVHNQCPFMVWVVAISYGAVDLTRAKPGPSTWAQAKNRPASGLKPSAPSVQWLWHTSQHPSRVRFEPIQQFTSSTSPLWMASTCPWHLARWPQVGVVALDVWPMWLCSARGSWRSLAGVIIHARFLRLINTIIYNSYLDSW